MHYMMDLHQETIMEKRDANLQIAWNQDGRQSRKDGRLVRRNEGLAKRDDGYVEATKTRL
jgi:hypothetical protein